MCECTDNVCCGKKRKMLCFKEIIVNEAEQLSCRISSTSLAEVDVNTRMYVSLNR